jgi:glycine dehydrogenase subunit 2
MTHATIKKHVEPKAVAKKPALRRFHQASWDEPVIFELSVPGQRGILPPEPEAALVQAVGDPADKLPESLKRKAAPALPEMSQLHVLRHYMRISQETLGVDLNIDIGQGTCTMKYSPKVNDQLARSPKMSELHPLQPVSSVQGILEVMYKFEGILKEISGMDRVTLQPGAGSSAIYANISMIRAYHTTRGENEQRNEVITTIFSHPSNAAAAKVAGYKVITLYPDADGYPDLEALKAAVSKHTAALMVTNPEDTGVFNPRIEEFVRIVHAAGGLCSYDQANANGLLGITRARDAGFDVCHFNLHKTFSTPHGCGGPAAGACGVTKEMSPFLPTPTVEFDGDSYHLDFNRPQSIGKIRPWYGVAPNILKAYAWVMSLGADGLREISEIAVLNNNYLLSKVLEIRGVSMPYTKGKRRIEQVRYSWEQLTNDTGVHSEEIGFRAADFGTHYWTSHHPFVVPEPMTLEPTESYSKDDMDEYVTILKHISEEAYTNPEIIHTAPHNSVVHKIDQDSFDDPEAWAVTWRAYRRKVLKIK